MSVTDSGPARARLSDSDVLVGIPAYNEAAAVGDIVRSSREVADAVVVVDDGSDDRTAMRAAEAGAEVVRHEKNSGYGAALGTLFETANERDADHLVVVDADGQHDPAQVPGLVATQRASNAEIVIGSRFIGSSQSDTPLYRRIGLAVINTLVGASLRFGYSVQRIRDTQSGFRAYDADAIELLAERADLSDGMDASVDILFQAAQEGHEFVEAPVDVTYDVADEANTHNPVVHGAVLVRNVAGRVLSERPGRSLGGPGVICLGLGVTLGLASSAGLGIVTAIPRLVVTLLIALGIALAGAAFTVGTRRPSRD
ncbi:glycosyltransferase family 2 protein [Halobacteriales archaeon QS_5_68_33]|nr:MAG: glycosyltransferase family 2 protein [Halobacteriales archaeon QS_5_68_33]